MIVRIRAFALVCAVLAVCGEANGQSATDQLVYPSTGFPPWTPLSGIPPLPEKRRPDPDRLLLDASTALQACGRDGEAITVLKMVFEGKNEPTNRLSDDANSRHEACKQLSGIYERQGELSKALECAILARDKYRYIDWCGLVAVSMQKDIDERIAALSERVQYEATKQLPAGPESRRTAGNATSLQR